VLNSTVEHHQRDWSSELNNLAYAFGGPKIRGQIKTCPEDFRVSEQLEIVPTGTGEHYWLHVSKTKWNTDQLAKELAKFAGVARRDIGYSGRSLINGLACGCRALINQVGVNLITRV